MESMKVKTRVLSIAILLVMALSAFSVPMNLGIREAFAVVTLETSADNLGNRFFNESLLEVEIEDTAADDSATDSINVDLEVRSNTGTLLFDGTVVIDDTTNGSQIFEFFLRPLGSTIVPQDADDDTPADTLLDVGGAGAEVDIGQALAEDFTIRITYGGQSKTISYNDSPSSLTVDRDAFGTGNTIFVTVNDQDGNADPTNRDTINSTTTILAIQGDDGFDEVACLETGRNTAAFECEFLLNQTDTGANVIDIPVAEVVSLVLTITDASQYKDDTGDGEITATDTDVDAANLESGTDSETITIEDTDGNLEQVNDPSMGSELVLDLDDIDRNLNSKVENDIIGAFTLNATNFTLGAANLCFFDASDLEDAGNFGVIVYIDEECGDVEVVDMTESGDNTGVFVPDLANDELKITFLNENEDPVASDGTLQFTSATIGGDIVIAYVDGAPDDTLNPLTSSFTKELAIVAGTINVPSSAGVNSNIDVTVTDADLNNDPRSKDSYTVTFLGLRTADTDGDGDVDANDGDEFEMLRGGASIGDAADEALYATLELQIKGESANFATSTTYTFIETGINTGVFTASFDIEQIIDNLIVAQQDVDDGDEFEFTYNDYMEDPEDSDSAELTIGRPDSTVDFSRDVLPIPPANGGVVETAIGSDIVTTDLLITDADANDNSGSEDQITVALGTNFEVEVDGEGFNLVINNPGAGANGANLDFPGTPTGTLNSIMFDDFEGTVLTETGSNTGVFETTLTFVRSTLTSKNWQDATITFSYTDAADNTDSNGITFRGNDAAMEANLASVKSGDLFTINLQDLDLNLDDAEIEEFDASFVAGGLLLIEAEDDDIDQGSTTSETFTETGENTGVFTAEFEIGTDIIVTDVPAEDQASNIHLEYDEEIASDGGDGDEIELDIPVVTGTGAIQISPDLVGPNTEITVLIIDSDLNEDPASADDLSETDVTDGDLIEVTTSRDEVENSDEESPGVDETGPNTGVFEFTIKLDAGTANQCADEEVPTVQEVNGNEMDMGACPGDFIAIKYEDKHKAGGGSAVISKLVEVKSWDPEFAADKPSYAVGDRPSISISDPDANDDPDVADSLRDIKVTSDTDVVGADFSALETGADTGVFRLSFALTPGATGGGINVKSGDLVEIEYTDEFPADFLDQEEDKEFVFTIEVGGAAPTPLSTTPSTPTARDVQNRVVDEVTVGQQVVLSTTVVNNIADDLPFATLIEVRDRNEVTIFLSWQTGTLTPGGRTDIGIAWTPDTPGDYEVRTFVLSSLERPQILSPVATGEIAVS